jgi:regulator of protease activity HflC (stomatin/prohibitin superfamily)
MFRKRIIDENQRGFLFNNGKYQKMLATGKYYLFGDREIEIVFIDQPLNLARIPLEALLADKAVADSVNVVEVGDEELCLHFINGKFSSVLRHGKHAFWSIVDKHEFQLVNISSPEVSEDVPAYIFSKIPQMYYTKVEVAEYQKARLYFDQKLVRILDAGTYYFWKTATRVDVSFVDTRLTQMNIVGQEMLTADKVSLRINFVCNYRITDYVKILTEVDNYEEQMHVAAQLALREFVGRYKLDEILENKEKMTECVFEKLKSKEADLFVEITDAGVKDIILPGEIREIMNTVLVAEKRAQANVITRREEVASTRSLLNTARLMDENKTLYKLKELEYIERICENVGNINISNSGDLLTQLAGILRGKE